MYELLLTGPLDVGPLRTVLAGMFAVPTDPVDLSAATTRTAAGRQRSSAATSRGWVTSVGAWK
jgi:hypothetical protein